MLTTLGTIPVDPSLLPERQRPDPFVVELQHQNFKLWRDIEALQEGIAELVNATDSAGWTQIGGSMQWRFKREDLRRITDQARSMYLKSPLVHRTVAVDNAYIWGSGITIKGAHPAIDEVVQDFITDLRNRPVFGSTQSFLKMHEAVKTTGNRFFCLYPNMDSGRVRIRRVPFDEITEIYTNPQDRDEPWFYLRQFAADADGQVKRIWYRDVYYNPVNRKDPPKRDNSTVDWDHPIYHMKRGGLDEMEFGLTELYSTLDWALAYKIYLEDFLTIKRAQARYATKITGLQGKNAVAAAQTQFQTGLQPGNELIDTNPPKLPGATFFGTGTANVEVVRQAGGTDPADSGNAVRNMFASGSNLPSTFYGDADTGSYATATTLDRPTEVNYLEYQQYYTEQINNILQIVLMYSAKATNGKLNAFGATVEEQVDEFDNGITNDVIVMPVNDDKKYGPVGEEIATTINIQFPVVVQRAFTDSMRGLVNAITLGGHPAEGIIPDRRFACRLLLRVMADNGYITDVEETLKELYPDGPEFQPRFTGNTGGSQLAKNDAAPPDAAKSSKNGDVSD